MALIDSYISHDKPVSVSNVLREHNVMKEEIKKILKLLRVQFKLLKYYP